MEVLRQGAFEQLQRQLDQGLLSRHHFACDFNGEDGCIVEVVFRDNPNFYFRILQPETNSNSSRQWVTRESPGVSFTTEELYDHRDYSIASGRLGSWVARVIEELLVVDHQAGDLIEKLRSNLETAANELVDPDIPFTPEELLDWSKKFDEMVAKLETLQGEHELQRGELNQLRNRLDQLVEHGTEMPKRTWVKSAGNKVLDLFDSGAKSGFATIAKEAVRALLGGG